MLGSTLETYTDYVIHLNKEYDFLPSYISLKNSLFTMEYTINKFGKKDNRFYPSEIDLNYSNGDFFKIEVIDIQFNDIDTKVDEIFNGFDVSNGSLILDERNPIIIDGRELPAKANRYVSDSENKSIYSMYEIYKEMNLNDAKNLFSDLKANN